MRPNFPPQFAHRFSNLVVKLSIDLEAMAPRVTHRLPAARPRLALASRPPRWLCPTAALAASASALSALAAFTAATCAATCGCRVNKITDHRHDAHGYLL